MNKRAATLFLALLTGGASGQMGKFQSITLPHPPATTGCQVFSTRPALETALRNLGYAGALPAVDWDNGSAALIQTSEGKVAPDSFREPSFTHSLLIPANQTVIFTNPSPAITGQVAFVMQITKSAAAAAGCEMLDRSSYNLLISQNHPQQNTGFAANPFEPPQRATAPAPAPIALKPGGAHTTGMVPGPPR